MTLIVEADLEALGVKGKMWFKWKVKFKPPSMFVLFPWHQVWNTKANRGRDTLQPFHFTVEEIASRASDLPKPFPVRQCIPRTTPEFSEAHSLHPNPAPLSSHLFIQMPGCLAHGKNAQSVQKCLVACKKNH